MSNEIDRNASAQRRTSKLLAAMGIFVALGIVAYIILTLLVNRSVPANPDTHYTGSNGVSVYYDSSIWKVCQMTEDSTLGTVLELATADSADGEDYGCYIMGYDLSKGSLSVADGDDYAQPDVVLVGPNKIQGVVVGEDDTVTLSQSYGRKNNASLLHYSLALGETLDTMLTVQGRDVPGYILDSKRLKESVTAMPMTEALADAKDGGIYVLFESGAIHYANGTFRTDHVWKIKF